MIDFTPPPAIVVIVPKVQTEEEFYAELMEIGYSLTHGDGSGNEKVNLCTITRFSFCVCVLPQEGDQCLRQN
jgi:hypothetical protein